MDADEILERHWDWYNQIANSHYATEERAYSYSKCIDALNAGADPLLIDNEWWRKKMVSETNNYTEKELK